MPVNRAVAATAAIVAAASAAIYVARVWLPERRKRRRRQKKEKRGDEMQSASARSLTKPKAGPGRGECHTIVKTKTCV